jgi:hypothetical protein
MSEEIKVYVIDKKRTNLYLRYIDPATGQSRLITAARPALPAVGERARWPSAHIARTK